MKKRVLVGLVCLLLAVSVFAIANYENMGYYVRDKVSGNNLELTQFQDDFGLIDSLLYNEQLKKSTNTFSAEAGFGVPISGDPIYEASNLKFKGEASFDDKSSVKYELADFKLVDTDVDEYGVTSIRGNGVLVYTATIKIERAIPVEVMFDFYQDVEDKDGWDNYIRIDGIDHNELGVIELEGKEVQTFRHNRKCYVGCD